MTPSNPCEVAQMTAESSVRVPHAYRHRGRGRIHKPSHQEAATATRYFREAACALRESEISRRPFPKNCCVLLLHVVH